MVNQKEIRALFKEKDQEFNRVKNDFTAAVNQLVDNLASFEPEISSTHEDFEEIKQKLALILKFEKIINLYDRHLAEYFAYGDTHPAHADAHLVALMEELHTAAQGPPAITIETIAQYKKTYNEVLTLIQHMLNTVQAFGPDQEEIGLSLGNVQVLATSMISPIIHFYQELLHTGNHISGEEIDHLLSLITFDSGAAKPNHALFKEMLSNIKKNRYTS